MASGIEQWASVLPHRSNAELSAVVGRLERAGITAEELRRTICALGDDLWERRAAVEVRDEAGLSRDALVLVELGMFLSYAQERVAAMRRNTYAELLESKSLAGVADILGVTRQAVHKSVSGKTVRDSFVSHLGFGRM